MGRKGLNGDALGEVIQSGRFALGLSREDFSELVDVSLRYLISIENESKKPSFKVLYRMIRALGADANAVFFPENRADDSPAQRCSRLLQQCEEHEILAISALVETLLMEKAKRR
jgi:transcriptional regulator with XRE-family HTH domain